MPPLAPSLRLRSAAIAASIALHGAALATLLSRGAAPGREDGLVRLQVEILTERQAAEPDGPELAKPAPPATPEAVRGPDADARGDPARGETEQAASGGSAPEGPRVVESTASTVLVERRDAAPGAQAPGRGEGRAGKAERTSGKSTRGREAGRAGQAQRTARARPQGEERAPKGETSDGAGLTRRSASLGALGQAAGAMPPAWREVFVALLQEQIERCYAAPAGASRGVVLPVLEIHLRVDGGLAGVPRTVRAGRAGVDAAIAAAALHAVRRCAPYRIPVRFAPYYADWKDIEAEFEFPPT